MLSNLLSNEGLIFNLLSCVTPSCGTSTAVTSLLLQASTIQRHSTPATTPTLARYSLPLSPLLSSSLPSPHLPLSPTSSLLQLYGSDDDDVPSHSPSPSPKAADVVATANSNGGKNGNNGNNGTISSPPSRHRHCHHLPTSRHHPPASLSLPHRHSHSFTAVMTTTSLPTTPAPLQQPLTLLRRQTTTMERTTTTA
jgi:hypothetical protein